MKDVNYSKIFIKYEKDPLRKKGIEESLVRVIRENYSKEEPFRIIDIGCGTGNWLNTNFNNLSYCKNIEWFGLDISEGMLSLAGEKNSDFNLVLASADSLPFFDNSFNFIINEFTYHHFKNKEKSFGEHYRVMRKKGNLIIRNIVPWEMSDWSLYYFFPTTRELDRKRFLRTEPLISILSNIGFKDINININTMHGNEYKTVDRWVEIMNNRTHSELQIISDKEYFEGMKKIKDMFINSRKELEKILNNSITTIFELQARK